jgi:hypothetical protein
MPTENKTSGQAVWVSRLLVVLGVVLLIFGLVSLVVAFPPCPINACPRIFSAYYAVYWGEIFAGLVMIALGIGLRLQARRIQRRLAAQHSTSAASSSPAPSVQKNFANESRGSTVER